MTEPATTDETGPPVKNRRKEKRKALKKEKRKQIRKELAKKARAVEEALSKDPEEQRRIQLEEQKEKERIEADRQLFEDRERTFLLLLQQQQQLLNNTSNNNVTVDTDLMEGPDKGSNEQQDDNDEYEYVEDGPPEIIWQGNEIIVKKNKVRVKKKINQDLEKEDPNRPTSNPLPPQSEAYAAHRNAPTTVAELLDTVAQQVPNFGTEQDKDHCPFHLKTGACRFGLRCNRVHYYPDKSTTLLMKNMFNGPGLAWEQDEGLEFTDEEIERSYEDFYEDVHTEFLKFGEIVNFKVCRNGSFHLRGNVYVHYKSLDSAVMAYNSVHCRFFAGKQVKCDFVSLTRWKVAICGEYMKSRLKTCSRGSACNFLHCFSNPGGDYEWADCDKPPPRYWVKKMTALFGYSDEIDKQSPKDQEHSNRIFASDRDSYHYRRHRSIETTQHSGSCNRSHHEEKHVHHHEQNHARTSKHRERDVRKYQEDTKYKNDTDSDGQQLDRFTDWRDRYSSENRPSHNRKGSKSGYYCTKSRTHDSSDEDLYAKKRSRHKVLGSSNVKVSGDTKHEATESKLRRHDRHKTNSSMYHRRSRRNHDEVDHEESEDEPVAKKQNKHNSKSAKDRSWSRDNEDLLDKSYLNDRWEPDRSPNEHDKHNKKIIMEEKTGKVMLMMVERGRRGREFDCNFC
uniref:zinc finger CCCH domain-containing protein 5 isoform X2 n=1 Tax=Erigeron canadensis TaxID=72917 RepID=UPI001CB9C63C|nr:zinc finger CCCH domain-containing protein 5 isoform X2 [Erigeron canadensis]